MNSNQAAAVRHTDAGMPSGRKDPLWKKLAVRLKKIRELAGLSQRRLAVLACLSHVTILGIEAGLRSAGIDTIERIASALGVPPCWLAFGYEGQEIFQPRRPRSPVPYDPPVPALHEIAFSGLHLGFADRLKLARREAQISMRALAEKTGLSVETVLGNENGEQVPRIETVELLAKALRVSPCWLAFGDPIIPGPRLRRAALAT